MVLRDWYIHRANTKRQEQSDACELAPYQEYLDEAIDRLLARERTIRVHHLGRTRRPQISLAQTLVKLPIKSLSALEDRFCEARYSKNTADQLRRAFLEWLATTKPHLDSPDPQEHVRRFSEIHKTPFLKGYDEGYREGGEAARRNRATQRAQPTENNGKNGN